MKRCRLLWLRAVWMFSHPLCFGVYYLGIVAVLARWGRSMSM